MFFILRTSSLHVQLLSGLIDAELVIVQYLTK